MGRGSVIIGRSGRRFATWEKRKWQVTRLSLKNQKKNGNRLKKMILAIERKKRASRLRLRPPNALDDQLLLLSQRRSQKRRMIKKKKKKKKKKEKTPPQKKKKKKKK